MRIGSIAQHANIGPKGGGPEAILPDGIIPGRLNNFDIIGWWDFTDYIHAGASTDSTTNLIGLGDKGPYNASLFSDFPGSKGPTYPKIGQDSHRYTALTSTAFDSMKFTNPIDINSRKFTATMICDFSGTTLSKDFFLFRLNGTDNSALKVWFDDYISFDRLFVGREKSGYDTKYSYAGDSSAYFDGTTGGDLNYNFNWITIVLEADGTVSAYMRGKKLNMGYTSGTFADTTIASKDTISYVFDNRTSSTGTASSTNDQMGGRVYEIMMFNESLSESQVYDIDMYVKEKYPSYAYGRVNGY